MHVETTISRLCGEKHKKALVNFAFDRLFAVSGVQLMQEGKNYRLNFPRMGIGRSGEDHQSKFEAAHPLCTDFRKELTEMAVQAYYQTARNFPAKYHPEEWTEKKLQEN